MTDSKYPNVAKLGLTIDSLYGESYSYAGMDTISVQVVRADDLEKLLSQAVRVYGWAPNSPSDWYRHKDAHIKTKSSPLTHQALLICIEELPKLPCKHEPHTVDRWHNILCKHCGEKLVARWKAEGE